MHWSRILWFTTAVSFLGALAGCGPQDPHAKTAARIETLTEERKVNAAHTEILRSLRDHPDSPSLLRAAIRFYWKFERPSEAAALGERLAEHGNIQAVFREGLQHSDPVVRKMVIRTIPSINTVDLSSLLQLAAKDKDPDIRATVIRAAMLIRNKEEAARALSILTRDPEPRLQIEAIRALGSVQHENAVHLLSEALKGAETNLRYEIARALGGTASPQAEPILVALLNDVSFTVRAEAVSSLGRLKASRRASDLLRLLDDPDGYVRTITRDTLANLATPENQEVFLPLLQSESPEKRHFGAVVLSKVGNPAGLDLLRESIHSTDPRIRAQAIIALGVNLNDQTIIPTLERWSKDRSLPREVQTASILALQAMLKRQAAEKSPER